MVFCLALTGNHYISCCLKTLIAAVSRLTLARQLYFSMSPFTREYQAYLNNMHAIRQKLTSKLSYFLYRDDFYFSLKSGNKLGTQLTHFVLCFHLIPLLHHTGDSLIASIDNVPVVWRKTVYWLMVKMPYAPFDE